MEDLDHADDLALLSYTHLHIKGKTQRLNTFVKKVGLNISSKRTEIMALNTINRRPVQIDNEELPYTDRFHPSPVEIEELTWTSRAVSDTQPEARTTWWIKYGAPLLTVLVLSWNSITAASWQLSPVWFRMLALDGEGIITPVHVSYQEPSAYPKHLQT